MPVIMVGLPVWEGPVVGGVRVTEEKMDHVRWVGQKKTMNPMNAKFS